MMDSPTIGACAVTRITRDHVLSTGATIFYHAEDDAKRTDRGTR